MSMLTMPCTPEAWPAFLTAYSSSRLDDAKTALATLSQEPPASAAAWLATWCAADASLQEAMDISSLIAETHPDAQTRKLSDDLYAQAKTVGLDRYQDAATYAALEALDLTGLDAPLAEVAARARFNFQAQGAHLPENARERLAELNRTITALSTQFSENIRDAQGSIRISPDRLTGLPQDYIEAHPADEDGLVTITTDYPDLLPFLDMARDHAARRELMLEDRNKAYPANEQVLRELLAARHEKATILGFKDYPSYATAGMMMPDGDSIGAFIDEVRSAAHPAGLRDVGGLLEILKRERPELTGLAPSDTRYAIELLKAERHGVDQQSVRSYLRYERVRDGILKLMEHLFGASYVRVEVPTWHEHVESYDVVDNGAVIGRIHLDMHPRAGKFGHAACFGLVPGIAGRNLPESVLVCNFSRGLLTHDELETFLHEFGHLIHAIFSGHHPYSPTAGFGESWEWDFIEAPSQLLEEWAWNADVLQRFAVNDAGEPIPTDLVDAMRAARYSSAGLLTCRQLVYGALSYRLHRDHPEDLDALAAAVEAEYDVRERMEGGHDWASFGHLTDYASNYYTYQWSLSICHDLLTAFDKGNLLDRDVASRYRQFILEPGATKPATTLVSDFLGRPYSTAAYQEWLASL